jgi:16S rRNA (uracil1498-N3)-methyltransferase
LKQFGETKRIMLCIGPEGGFSEKEARTAADRGFVITSLGKRILRAETATIAALAIVQFGLGDMGTVS